MRLKEKGGYRLGILGYFRGIVCFKGFKIGVKCLDWEGKRKESNNYFKSKGRENIEKGWENMKLYDLNLYVCVLRIYIELF